jgi:RluA family pseudouridine synthase
MESNFSWTCEAASQGTPLGHFLSLKLGSNYSKRNLKVFVERGCCQLNGKIERFASKRLKRGDRIKLALPKDQKIVKKIKFDPSMLIAETEEFLVLNKPAFLTISPESLSLFFGKSYPQVHIVHRIDKETTGLLIVAKDVQTKKAFEDLFRKREIQKRYLAVVEGVPKKTQGSIDKPLAKQHVKGQVVVKASSSGKPASTNWKCLKSKDLLSFLELEPYTGRTHQLRVHLQSIGLPILGDDHYYREFKYSPVPSRFLLHAYQLSFTWKGEDMEFCSPIPNDFHEAGWDLTV